MGAILHLEGKSLAASHFVEATEMQNRNISLTTL